jgi:peroxiredoxin Q/BCP
LQQLGITVVGVSYDTPEKNRAFAEKNDLPFRLLSDRDRELAKAVGASRALLPVPKRVSYLIGSDGTILEAYPDVDPKTHAEEVIGDYRGMITAAD